MKKLLFFVAIAVITFSSCSHSIYPVESLYANYNAQMRNKTDLEIKSKVKIYFNEKDINGEYTIISINSYKPFSLFPLKSLQEKKLQKKFLSEAAKQAYTVGGNAILINSTAGANGSFIVLNLVNWNSDDETAAEFINPIYNMDKANKIKNGLPADIKRSERTRIENALIDEIESDLQNIYELAEIEVVREKIRILSNYNLTLKKPKKNIDKAVTKGTVKCNVKEKIIIKRNKKAEKQAQNSEQK